MYINSVDVVRVCVSSFVLNSLSFQFKILINLKMRKLTVIQHCSNQISNLSDKRKIFVTERLMARVDCNLKKKN